MFTDFEKKDQLERHIPVSGMQNTVYTSQFMCIIHHVNATCNRPINYLDVDEWSFVQNQISSWHAKSQPLNKNIKCLPNTLVFCFCFCFPSFFSTCTGTIGNNMCIQRDQKRKSIKHLIFTSLLFLMMQTIWSVSGRFKEKSPISSLWWEPFQWHKNFHFDSPRTNLIGFKRGKEKKKIYLPNRLLCQ